MSVRCQKSPGPQSSHHFRTYCLAKCLIALQPAVVHSGCSKDLDNCEDDYRDYLRGLQPPPFGPSVVIQRPFVERVLEVTGYNQLPAGPFSSFFAFHTVFIVHIVPTCKFPSSCGYSFNETQSKSRWNKPHCWPTKSPPQGRSNRCGESLQPQLKRPKREWRWFKIHPCTI